MPGAQQKSPRWKRAIGPWDQTGACANKTFLMLHSEDAQDASFSSFVLFLLMEKEVPPVE